jgi:hypothetical protein
MSPTLLRILTQRRRPTTAPTDRATRYVRKEPPAFVELNTRQNHGYTVSLQWNPDTGTTQIIIDDTHAARPLVIPIPAANANDAFHHPFRYAP